MQQLEQIEVEYNRYRLESSDKYPNVIDVYGKELFKKILFVTNHFQTKVWTRHSDGNQIDIRVDGADRWDDLAAAGVLAKILYEFNDKELLINLGHRRNKDGAGSGAEYLITLHNDYIESKKTAEWGSSWESLEIDYEYYCFICESKMKMKSNNDIYFIGCTKYPVCNNRFLINHH